MDWLRFSNPINAPNPKMFSADRVDEYMKMLKKVEDGRAERWQATQLFRKMTGPDMDEIARRMRKERR